MATASSVQTDDFRIYLGALRKTPLDQKTEHTDRGALEALLSALAGPDILVQHEPKRQDDKGSPDFKVTVKGAILGYVEVKQIGANLDAVLKSDQIKKYRQLSENILLTDYLHFIWLGPTGIQRDNLAFPSDLKSPKFKPNPDRAAIIANLIGGFFSIAPQGISRAQDLASALATRGHLLREGLAAALLHQQAAHTEGKLYGLLGAFRAQVFHELTIAEFADAFAQMLAYGLFLARLNADQPVTLDNARQFIPNAFPLIRELVDFITELRAPDYAPIRWLVEEILSIMNALDLAAIRQDLSFSNRRAIRRKVRAGSEEEHRLFERDPFVYFYEDFLAKYDAKLRKSRGVYYTPPPVVNFIIRAVDDILKQTFNIPDGLADHKRVTLLDFATGTGTFILEALEKMFETIGGSEAKRALLVREHILRNIFGFEYLIAPYTIAHLKLSQYLADKGFPLTASERLQIYLTNTLEPIAPQPNFLLPALSAEAEAAQEIKKRPILVIIGNPPYSAASKNNGPWAKKSINAYKVVDGKPLGERNPRWLNDDYVKFIRFAQVKIDAVPEGVIGIITNHSFLDNPTFRGMRQSLMASFDKIYLLDLHGSNRRKENSPDGSKDENVFDIEQGVSVSLFIKSKRLKERGVWRADLWGSRLAKYEICARTSFEEIDWRQIMPTTPSYLFIRENKGRKRKFDKFHSIREIFPINGTGIITKRDALCIKFSVQEVWDTINQFEACQPRKSYEKFDLPDDVRDWKVEWAQADLRSHGLRKSSIKRISYRPFDTRFTYYTGNSRGFIGWPVEKVMRHMLHDNVALLTARSNKSQDTDHFFVSAEISETKCAEATTQSSSFPLYLYPPDSTKKPKNDLFGENDPFEGKARIENIGPKFRAAINQRYGTPYFTPEQIFGYVYAVLFAPTYRARYAAFLRMDFPRIPLAETRNSFEALAGLGWDLAQIHLMKTLKKSKLGQYRGKGDNPVEKPRYAEAEQAVHINATQSFAPVPPAIWNFHIGGYQVLEKYLKSRKGRTLSLDEVTNVESIVAALDFTIGQMAQIDAAYISAFSS